MVFQVVAVIYHNRVQIRSRQAKIERLFFSLEALRELKIKINAQCREERKHGDRFNF